MCLTVPCSCSTARCSTHRLARWTLRCFIQAFSRVQTSHAGQIPRRSRLSLWHAHKTRRVWNQSCPSLRWICLKIAKRAPYALVENQSFSFPWHCLSVAPSLPVLPSWPFLRAFPYPQPGDVGGSCSAPVPPIEIDEILTRLWLDLEIDRVSQIFQKSSQSWVSTGRPLNRSPGVCLSWSHTVLTHKIHSE